MQGKTLLQIDYHGLLSGQALSPGRACTLGRVTARGTRRALPGRPLVVVAQRPAAGAVVPYFTKVSLVLARADRVRPEPCSVPRGGDLIARTRGMVIYRTFAPRDDDIGTLVMPVAVPTWRACLRSSGRRRAIYTASAADGTRSRLAQFKVAGSVVAYARDQLETKYSGGDVYRRIAIFDVAAGKESFLTDIGMTPGANPAGAPPAPDVISLTVNSRGYAAWTTRDTTGMSLYVHDSRARALIDHAATAPIANLELDGDTLSWTNGGAPRSTTLG